MKALFLLRHAKSGWDDPTLLDHDRPLNERGCLDAVRVGRWMKEQGLFPDLILSSTARRARDTAVSVAQALGYAEKIELRQQLYDASSEAYRLCLTQVETQCDRVLLVGHNPTLEQFLREHTGQTCHLGTAALVYLKFSISRWAVLTGETRAELVNIWRPRELKAEGFS